MFRQMKILCLVLFDTFDLWFCRKCEYLADCCEAYTHNYFNCFSLAFLCGLLVFPILVLAVLQISHVALLYGFLVIVGMEFYASYYLLTYMRKARKDAQTMLLRGFRINLEPECEAARLILFYAVSGGTLCFMIFSIFLGRDAIVVMGATTICVFLHMLAYYFASCMPLAGLRTRNAASHQ